MSDQSERVKREAARERWAFFAYWAVLLTAIVSLGVFQEFVLFWLIPMFTSAIAIGWLAELAEHYPLPESENVHLFMTRNRNGSWLENFLIGRHGDRYHLIHHLIPNIPCYQHKAAHKELLKDEAYRKWNEKCGGIFTKKSSDEESLVSFIIKYRDWQKSNTRSDNETFCQHLLRNANGLDRINT